MLVLPRGLHGSEDAIREGDHRMRTLALAGLFALLTALGACTKPENGLLPFDNNCSGNGLSDPNFCAKYTKGM